VADVLRNVDTSMFMRTADWLQAQMASDERPIIVATAVVFLRTLGHQKAFNLSGGLSAWERQGKPLETSSL
jgi:rhodanese-related sulfurtransferase